MTPQLFNNRQESEVLEMKENWGKDSLSPQWRQQKAKLYRNISPQSKSPPRTANSQWGVNTTKITPLHHQWVFFFQVFVACVKPGWDVCLCAWQLSLSHQWAFKAKIGFELWNRNWILKNYIRFFNNVDDLHLVLHLASRIFPNYFRHKPKSIKNCVLSCMIPMAGRMQVSMQLVDRAG